MSQHIKIFAFLISYCSFKQRIRALFRHPHPQTSYRNKAQMHSLAKPPSTHVAAHTALSLPNSPWTSQSESHSEQAGSLLSIYTSASTASCPACDCLLWMTGLSKARCQVLSATSHEVRRDLHKPESPHRSPPHWLTWHFLNIHSHNSFTSTIPLT